MIHLGEVFERLRNHKLFVKRSKCAFGQSSVSFLGHVVSGEGVTVEAEKIKAVLEWPCPKNVKELRGFLGLTGYYRRFVKGYGSVAEPLTKLPKKDSFGWNTAAQEAFQTLKKLLTETPVLALPDFIKPFVIECDASNCGVGAVMV